MWWLCYCVGIIVGVAARSSGDYPRDSWLSFPGTSQPEASGTRDDVNDDFVPTLNSGMNILEDNAEENKEIIPILSSGMNIDKQTDKREANKLNVDDQETINEEDIEKLFSTIPSLLDKKIEADAETASEEEVEDEINVQVKVDTAAEVSTEIRRPQITHRNGKIERRGKLKIIINIKTQKDEPKPFEVPKDLFDKDQKDYDQKTCDWLNAIQSNQNLKNSSWTQWIKNGLQQGPLGAQAHVRPQGPGMVY